MRACVCLLLQDQDQEVKECAISCMAAAVASLGDVLGADVAQVRASTFRCIEVSLSDPEKVFACACTVLYILVSLGHIGKREV